ncbi:MAG: sigma 54-interacting transcriptional regulator [Syntrophomonadaceae bacterium]|jgi:PAS domain S-box-containing protein
MENNAILPGKLFFDNIPDMALIVRPDGRIVEANPAACAAYGYEKDELLALDIFKLTPAYLHGLLLEQFKKAKSGGVLIEMLQHDREGKDIPVEMNLQPVRYQEELFFLCSIRDISHLLEILSKKEHLSWLTRMFTNIFMHITDGVIILDSEGRVNEVNLAAERILSKKVGEIKGQHIGQVLGIKTPYTNELLRRGKPYSDIEIFIERDKKSIQLTISGNPVRDEEERLTGAILFMRPIENIHNLVHRFTGNRASFQFEDIVTVSDNVLETIRIAAQAAGSISNVLLEGESGTGKEVFAQAIHNQGSRRNGPFIAVNCGAIPRELVGSELFGYAEGAFTGARKGGSPGKFELASGGTLFLDEIGDMPLEQQVTLLRVLQEKSITRIGDSKVIPIDVRVICATNKNLWEEVEIGSFRADLYYRLNVISIQIPPLRSRAKDIPLLFAYFLEKIRAKTGRNYYYDEEALMKPLQKYSWPGNIRELQNVVERMINIAGGADLSIEHLPPEIKKMEAMSTLTGGAKRATSIFEARQHSKKIRAEQEKLKIVALLDKHDGNVSSVAREMGYDRSTIYRKMRHYHIMSGE